MITYPVDVENTKWAIWSISGNTALRTGKTWPRADGGELVGSDPDLVPLLEVRSAKPAYDPATQKLLAATPVADIPNNTYTYGWNIVALTQSELDAIAAETTAQTERDQAKALYQDLKDGVGTATERLERVERVLARILKDTYS
jgi:hypothetical protein